jgi:hypothetical protein
MTKASFIYARQSRATRCRAFRKLVNAKIQQLSSSIDECAEKNTANHGGTIL